MAQLRIANEQLKVLHAVQIIGAALESSVSDEHQVELHREPLDEPARRTLTTSDFLCTVFLAAAKIMHGARAASSRGFP